MLYVDKLIDMYDAQQQFLISLYQHHNAVLDPIFRFLRYFDSEYFIFVFIPLVWIGFSYRWGIRFFYLLLFNALLNSWMKDLFTQPRPDMQYAMEVLKSYGFPSGGAQTAILLGSLLIYYWKNPWRWPLGLLYILLLSFTRLYLGVHYPTDVLGGWLFGLILFWLFVTYIDRMEKYAENHRLLTCTLIELGSLLLMVLTPKPKYFYLLSCIMAGTIGIFFSFRYNLYLPPPKKIWHGFLRAFLGIGGTFIIFFLLAPLSKVIAPIYMLFIKSIVLTFWLTLLVSPICKKITP